jgi:hypothetical protein
MAATRRVYVLPVAPDGHVLEHAGRQYDETNQAFRRRIQQSPYYVGTAPLASPYVSSFANPDPPRYNGDKPVGWLE